MVLSVASLGSFITINTGFAASLSRYTAIGTVIPIPITRYRIDYTLLRLTIINSLTLYPLFSNVSRLLGIKTASIGIAYSNTRIINIPIIRLPITLIYLPLSSPFIIAPSLLNIPPSVIKIRKLFLVSLLVN